MFQVGIVGCGGIGNTHGRNWSAMEGVRVAAVCDLNEEKARAAGESFDCPWYTHPEQLPAQLDAVSVATPPMAHYPVVRQLLEQGYPVFCEKSLTMEVEQGEELDRLAKEKGLVLAVGFKMRFESIFQEAKKYLNQVGKIVSINTTKLQAFNPRPEGAWVKRVGAMYELSVHDFDLITFLTGRYPQKVLFSQLRHRFGWEADDAFSITADYGDGITGMCQGMYAVSSTFCYRDLTITFLGDKGYMRIERPDRIILHTDAYQVIEVPPFEKSAFELELEHFRAAVEGREANTLTAAGAVRMTWLIEEAKRLSVE